MFRLVDRYILREVAAPALLGLFLYLAVLLVNSFFKLAELAVQQGVPLGQIGRLLLYLLPTLLTMTVPMAVLLGTLVGLASLASRSELIALRACGVSTRRMLVPVLLVGAMGTAASGWLYHDLVPRWNQAHLDLRLAIARAADITQTIRPRVFYEGLPGMVLYADDISKDGRTLRNLFLYREPSYPDRPEQEIYLAPKASLERLPDGTVRFELLDGTQHRVGRDPKAYEIVSFRRYLLQQDPAVAADEEAGAARAGKGPRQMGLGELRQALRRMEGGTDRPGAQRRIRTYEAEIHKRYAIPLAALVFAFLGFPLAAGTRRGGRAAGFAVSLGVILAYWVMITWGEDAAIQGRVSPWLGIWLPDLAFGAAAAALFVVLGREGRFPRLLRALSAGGAFLRDRLGPHLAVIARFLPRRRPPQERRVQRRGLGLGLMDQYVLTTYLGGFFLLFLSLYVIYVVGDYFLSKAKHVSQNSIPLAVVADYYRFLTPQVVQYVLPLSAMVAALVAFGLLASTNEVKAMVCSGVSVYRMIVPVVLAALCLSVVSYWIQDYVLPYTNRRAEALEDRIEGRSPRSHYRPDRRWVFGEDGRLYHYLRLDQNRGRFIRLEVLDLDPSFHMESRTFASQALWEGDGWKLQSGWNRTFGTQPHFATFTEREFPWDEPPKYFSAERKPPEEMGFKEYAHYIEELARSGYATRGMHAELWHKLSFPSVTLILVVIGVPFAFRMERKGALYGVGLAIGLGMIYYTMMAVFTALGRAELLPPLLAAFAPNVLFLAAGAYLLLNVRT